jgi:hypothetical protein
MDRTDTVFAIPDIRRSRLALRRMGIKRKRAASRRPFLYGGEWEA